MDMKKLSEEEVKRLASFFKVLMEIDHRNKKKDKKKDK